MWLTLLTRYWYIAVIAVMLGIIGVQTKRLEWSKAETEEVQKQINIMTLQWDAQKAVAVEATATFNKTLGEINANHSKLLAEAKENAIANFLRGKGAGSVNRNAAGGLQPQPNLPTRSSAHFAEGSEGLDARTTELVLDCAEDAFTITEWQRWATLNRLPIEAP